MKKLFTILILFLLVGMGCKQVGFGGEVPVDDAIPTEIPLEKPVADLSPLDSISKEAPSAIPTTINFKGALFTKDEFIAKKQQLAKDVSENKIKNHQEYVEWIEATNLELKRCVPSGNIDLEKLEGSNIVEKLNNLVKNGC